MCPCREPRTNRSCLRNVSSGTTPQIQPTSGCCRVIVAKKASHGKRSIDDDPACLHASRCPGRRYSGEPSQGRPGYIPTIRPLHQPWTRRLGTSVVGLGHASITPSRYLGEHRTLRRAEESANGLGDMLGKWGTYPREPKPRAMGRRSCRKAFFANRLGTLPSVQ